MNLLENAVKFTPEGGKVTVEALAGGFVVSDTGPGFEPSEDLFAKFHQGKQDGVKNPGAGLGLAIVKKLVDLHDGSVSCAHNFNAFGTKIFQHRAKHEACFRIVVEN